MSEPHILAHSRTLRNQRYTNGAIALPAATCGLMVATMAGVLYPHLSPYLELYLLVIALLVLLAFGSLMLIVVFGLWPYLVQCVVLAADGLHRVPGRLYMMTELRSVTIADDSHATVQNASPKTMFRVRVKPKRQISFVFTLSADDTARLIAWADTYHVAIIDERTTSSH